MRPTGSAAELCCWRDEETPRSAAARGFDRALIDLPCRGLCLCVLGMGWLEVYKRDGKPVVLAVECLAHQQLGCHSYYKPSQLGSVCKSTLGLSNEGLRLWHRTTPPKTSWSAPLSCGKSTSSGRETSACMFHSLKYVHPSQPCILHLGKSALANTPPASRSRRPKLGQVLPPREPDGDPVPARRGALHALCDPDHPDARRRAPCSGQHHPRGERERGAQEAPGGIPHRRRAGPGGVSGEFSADFARGL